MDSFMRFRLATIIRLADSDAPPKVEVKVGQSLYCKETPLESILILLFRLK